MPKLDFYFDTKKVNEDIANWRDLEIEVNFEDETGQGTVKSGSLEFVGALAEKIHTWNEQGMNGGAGIFEAPPFRIEVCGAGNVIFDGGINVAACETSYECDKITAALRTQTIDFLNDRASSFRFEYLTTLPAGSPGRIIQTDYILVPYVINSIPDHLSVMISGISLFTLSRELKYVITEISKAIKELIGHVVAAITSFVPPTTIVGVALAVGLVLVDIVKIILLIAYLIFIIKAIIQLILMIFDNIIQRVKYKKGMRVVDSFRKASAYLGFDFSSTLLSLPPHNNELIIPRKSALLTDKKINLTTLLGFPQKNKDFDDNVNLKSTGFFEGTFADLIVLYEDRFNAEIIIIGNTLHFETKGYFAKLASYTLPNIQRKNADPHTTNACELTANYHIIHALDDMDSNTYDQYSGTEAYMALSPIAISNKKNILLKGITEKRLNMALGKRKTELTAVETLFSNIYTTLFGGGINPIISQLIRIIKQQLKAISTVSGGGTVPKFNLLNFPANPFAARIGMLSLSSDFIGIQKVLIIDSTDRLISTNDYLTSAKYLMDKFHFTNFAVRIVDSDKNIKNDHDQWLIYTDKEVPFCCDDYEKVLNNNYCKTYDQKTAKIKSLVWNPYKSTARITYRVKEQYTKNLTNTYVIDGKQ